MGGIKQQGGREQGKNGRRYSLGSIKEEEKHPLFNNKMVTLVMAQLRNHDNQEVFCFCKFELGKTFKQETIGPPTDWLM